MKNNLFKEYVSTLNLLEELKLDLVKGMSGNKAAGVRARHQLRAVRDKAGNLVNLSLENSKTQHPGASRHHFGNEIASLFNAEC